MCFQWVDEHGRIDIRKIALTSSDSNSWETLSDLLRLTRVFRFPDFNTVSLPKKNLPTNLKKFRQLHCFGQLLLDLCSKNRIDRVVDVGCGLGHLLGWLRENSTLELVGVDCNDNFCSKGSNLYDGVTFKNVDITNESAFHKIACVEVCLFN